jgi:hypothetical protein
MSHIADYAPSGISRRSQSPSVSALGIHKGANNAISKLCSLGMPCNCYVRENLNLPKSVENMPVLPEKSVRIYRHSLLSKVPSTYLTGKADAESAKFLNVFLQSTHHLNFI